MRIVFQPGFSSPGSKVVVAVVQIGAMLACGGIGAGFGSLTKGAAEAAKSGVKTMTMTLAKRYAMKIKNLCETALKVGGLAMMGLAVYNGVRQYKAGNEQANLKELEGFIARLQQGLDESDEELQKIVEQMQALVGDILRLVTNPVETSEEIVQNINANMKSVRFELGNRVHMQLRIIPELKFFVDDSLDYAEHIDELLKK